MLKSRRLAVSGKAIQLGYVKVAKGNQPNDDHPKCDVKPGESILLRDENAQQEKCGVSDQQPNDTDSTNEASCVLCGTG
jgi:hypothetical protein